MQLTFYSGETNNKQISKVCSMSEVDSGAENSKDWRLETLPGMEQLQL